jgi:1,2-phenylacetyl-CoA epoxidase PaaB subunit
MEDHVPNSHILHGQASELVFNTTVYKPKAENNGYMYHVRKSQERNADACGVGLSAIKYKQI